MTSDIDNVCCSLWDWKTLKYVFPSAVEGAQLDQEKTQKNQFHFVPLQAPSISNRGLAYHGLSFDLASLTKLTFEPLVLHAPTV